MRALRGFRGACAAMALIALPFAAYGQSDADVSAEAMADLRCAIWAAESAGSDQADADTEAAFSFALTYFIGRFESLSGRDFDDVATMQVVVDVSNDRSTHTTLCAPRMQDIGDRMAAWGDRIQAEADALDAAGAGS